MEEWRKYKLKDFIEFNPKEKVPQGELCRKISMDQITPFTRFVESNIYEVYKGGAKFRNYDTIMARITPCLENGKTAYISSLHPEEVAVGSTEYIVLRKRENISDSKFIFYLAISPIVRDIAIKSMVGSSGRQRVQQDVLENYEIPIPSLPMQKNIAHILSVLDDKIELNKRINDNLEQQAQALFNYYFIDTPELLGEFSVGSLADAANYVNGLAMQKYRPINGEKGLPVLKIKELGQGRIDSSSDFCSNEIDSYYKVYDGDVIFSWSGTLMVKIWCGGKCGLNQHLFKVSSKTTPNWFYYFWTKHHLDNFIRIAKDKAVTMGHIKRGELEKAEVLFPNNSVMKKLDTLMAPFLDQIIEKECEIRKLALLRDTLLPKLISGELVINDINN